MRSALTWAHVAAELRHRPLPACLRLAAWQVEHPSAAGLTRSLGLPVGQVADWRMPHPNCHGLHVREYPGYYTAHVDQVNPRCDLPGHLAADVPLVASGAAFGALVGLLVGESASAMLVGAVLGGAMGAAAASAREAAACAGSSPRPCRPG
jgi:hypothetical protein